MFRLLLRDACAAGVLLALLAGATALLGLPAITAPPAAPWTLELARIGADPLLAPRDAALAAFALAAIFGLARALASGLRLAGNGYPATAHLAEALASRLARRAGALVGVALAVLPNGVTRSVGSSRGIPAPIPTLRATIVHTTAVAPAASIESKDSPAQQHGHTQERHAVRHSSARVPRLRIGLALRYTVQPDDTMDDVAARFGLPDWKPIMRATRGLPQPVGGPITDPNDIYPGQVLLIPLPCPALRLAGDQVLYVVQRGDYLSEIAARFLGDWRRYKEIGDLNRGAHQPDGGALVDDNLIQPGWVLRLPRAYVVPRPDGTAVTHRVVVDDLRPAHRRRNLRPRRPTTPHARGGTGRRLLGPPQSRQPRHPLTGPRPPVRSVPTAPHRPVAHSAHETTQGSHTRPSREHSASRRQGEHAGVGVQRHISLRPKPGVHPRKQRHPVPPRQSPAPAPTVAPRPLPTAVPHATPIARQGHEEHPPLSLPISDPRRWWPLPLLLVFAPLVAVVMHKRRQGATATPVTTPAGTHLAPSMRRAIDAVRNGVRGRLEQALHAATEAHPGDLVRPLLTALDEAGASSGAPADLAASTRSVTVSADRVEVMIEARHMTDGVVGPLMAALNERLGATVQGERTVGPDGLPRLRLTLTRPAVAALSASGVDQPPPHPAPLLVPLGRTSDGADLYANLARMSPILVAGGSCGANTLVATLLASTLAQAAPSQLRLLVASNDDELRHMLPALEHLEAPPADASDVAASARVVAQAHRVVLDRFTGGENAPITPVYLVVLDNVEELRADPRALDHLDVVCHNGRVCGVHIVATSNDPALLAEVGVLEAFGTRLARPLTEHDSALLFGDERAATLAPSEILLRSDDAAPATKLAPFLLSLPDVRQVIATIVVAFAPDAGPSSGAAALAVDKAVHIPHLSAPIQHVEGARRPDDGSDGRGVPPPQGQDGASVARADEDTSRTAGGDTGAAAGGAARERDQSAPPAADAMSNTTAGMPLTDQSADAHRAGPAMTGKPDSAMTDESEAACPPVAIRVLGGITVTAQDTPIVFQPREQRLLAALAVIGPLPVHPDRLVEVLFPDDDPLTGQDKLQHSITDIRLALKKAGLPVKRAGVVRHSTGGYTLDPALVGVDAYRFRDLLRRAETAESAERFVLLSEAVETYTGELCGDQALEWVEGYRYAWHKEYLEALYELALHYEQEGNDPLGALRVARRLAAAEPLQDHYHQMVLELITSTRDLDALDGYMEEIRAIYAGYDTEMGGYTQALYERLRGRLLREREQPDNSAKPRAG